MHSSAVMSFRQVLSVIWFPFFLAAAMSLLFVGTLASPHPTGMKIGVEGGAAVVAEIQAELDAAAPGGFKVEPLPGGQAHGAVIADSVAAALTGGEDREILIASATNTARANYLDTILPGDLGLPLRDVAMHAPGDASATGVFFYALPIAITGMVSAIVLLQLGMWSFRRKLLTISVIGVFTALVTYSIAVWQQVIPLTGRSSLILFATFALVTGIGWTLTGLSRFVKHFLVPIALTWVLILGIPTAGVPTSSDMTPVPLQILHEVMPLSQFVSLVRHLAYGVGGAAQPVLVLACWMVMGVVLIELAQRHQRMVHTAAPTTEGTVPLTATT